MKIFWHSSLPFLPKPHPNPFQGPFLHEHSIYLSGDITLFFLDAKTQKTSFVYQISVLLLFQQSSFFYCSNNQVIFIVPTIKLSYQLLFSIFTRIATPWQNPPFVRTLLPLLVARLDYHLYFNFSTEKYSTAICYFCLTSQRQRHQL